MKRLVMFLCFLVAGASLCHAQPDLTPYKPDNWNDKIPIGTSQLAFDQGHTYTGPYYSNQILYFNWGSDNQGDAPASDYTVYFEVSGTGGKSWTWPDVTTGVDQWTHIMTDQGVGPLSAGDHTFKLWLDYTGVVSESNDTNNYYERTINIESPPSQAEMVLNGASFARGDFFSATFKLNRSITQPFTVYAVVIMPDGSMLNARPLGPKVKPVASNVPRLDMPFSYTLIARNLPTGAPLGNYEVVAMFFNPSKPITGRAAAFLDVSGKFGIGTPAPTPTSIPAPTPTLDWYAKYGPGGTGDVVKIGAMYVASNGGGTGCNGGECLNWADAGSWANGLSWLEKDDWRMPTGNVDGELWTIAMNPGGYSFLNGCYWSSTGYDGAFADYAYACGWGGYLCCIGCSGLGGREPLKTQCFLVRVVRDVE